MGLFDRFLKPKAVTKPVLEPAPKPKPSKETKKSAKDTANEAGEPYVAILGMDIDPENLHQGSFELDWNEKFVANLVRAGYQGKTDADIVDLWFQNVCRHVVLETYEQDQAMNPQRYTRSKDLGNGRREVS
jgi:microsomal dipeptidase-like Zn-dependent dipeptidase